MAAIPAIYQVSIDLPGCFDLFFRSKQETHGWYVLVLARDVEFMFRGRASTEPDQKNADTSGWLTLARGLSALHLARQPLG